jgi:enoyl-CoA hydratase/carnithine racemase
MGIPGRVLGRTDEHRPGRVERQAPAWLRPAPWYDRAATDDPAPQEAPMPPEPYRCLRIETESGVATLTIDHPPINLFDAALIGEMDRAGRELAADPEVKVVVIRSDDPDFFIAHADVELILKLPVPPADAPPPQQPSIFQTLVDRFRSMPKATIALVEGICRGGGSELALSLDMRFAALGKAVFAQPEVAVGILPGGSGTQRLPRLCGRGRALEIVLGCEDFPADLAERYGWVNRALPPDEIRPFVERLARRIASFPADAIARAKAALIAGEAPWEPGLVEEAHQFDRCLASTEARARMEAFLAHGGQTRELEAQTPSPFAGP